MLLELILVACLSLPSLLLAFSPLPSPHRGVAGRVHRFFHDNAYFIRGRADLFVAPNSASPAISTSSASLPSVRTTVIPVMTEPSSQYKDHKSHTLLIHWKGEDAEGYSHKFRHVEFCGALSAVLNENTDLTSHVNVQARFENALEYQGRETVEMSPLKIEGYNQAMQFVSLVVEQQEDGASPEDITKELEAAVVRATKRCALIHALYKVEAETTTGETTAGSYDKLNDICLTHGGFADLQMHHDETNTINNTNKSWSLRVRHFGEKEDGGKERRYGHRARSMAMERKALADLEPLFSTFAGPVNLKHPDCRITVFDGLGAGGKTQVLARHATVGPKVSSINPNTRICVTNTPLCPVAAFVMCNVAQLGRPKVGDDNQQRHFTVLDPYAGSCAILLAAAMIETEWCQTVGIELAHNGIVNRDDVRRDFVSRNLTEPVALLHGDSSDRDVRAKARAAISHKYDRGEVKNKDIGDIQSQGFDAIITDPPYGIRESTSSMGVGDDGTVIRPVEELLDMIRIDRDAGTRLLKVGGRMVVFLPHAHEEESFSDIMPSEEQITRAGLRCEITREQPLNDVLSRWLVSFVCVE